MIERRTGIKASQFQVGPFKLVCIYVMINVPSIFDVFVWMWARGHAVRRRLEKTHLGMFYFFFHHI